MSIFTGAAVAIVTPFTSEGDVDYPALKRLLDFQIENGTDAIVICGTTGESSTLSGEEHMLVIRRTIQYVDHRVPVIAGTGSNDTSTAIMLSRQAEDDGADAVLIVTPYYNKATQKGLKLHYKAIADAIDVPIIMYNVPSRTGCNIQPETAMWLAHNCKNIVAIKEASSNISQIGYLMSINDGSLDMYSGNDDQIVPLLSLGGKGVISVLSNIAPRQTHDMVQKFFDGDVAGSCKMQLEATELVKALFCEVNPIPVKKAVELMGLCTGVVRAPMCEIEPEHEERLANAMRKYGLID